MEGHCSEDLRIIICLFSDNYGKVLYIFNIKYLKRNANSLSADKLAIVWTIC